jgi:deoxyribose-phosphate aldolase
MVDSPARPPDSVLAAVTHTVAALSPADERNQIISTVGQLDLTSLTGAETESDILTLCGSARQPWGEGRLHCAAVCVYPRHVDLAARTLRGSGVRTAAAAFGTSPGAGSAEARVVQIRDALEAGADEIDVVVTVDYVAREDWSALDREVRAFREAAGTGTLKLILEAGLVSIVDRLAQATSVVVDAGADFVKTSTGKSQLATLWHGAVMLQALGRYPGKPVGFKPAGGIRTVTQALEWRTLVRDVLGPSALVPERFRIGASSLLADLGKRLAELDHLRDESEAR